MGFYNRAVKAILVLMAGCLVAQVGVAQSSADDKLVRDLREFLMKETNKPEIMGLGLYDSFKFNSTKRGLFNRYNGHSTLAALGANNFEFHGFYTGLFISNIETHLDANSLLNPGLNQSNTTNIENATLNVHVDKLLFGMLYAGVLGGYGHSTFDVQSTLNNLSTLTTSLSNKTSFEGNNNYIGGRVAYFLPYGRKISLQGNMSYVYSSFFQPGYALSYDNLPSVVVPGLTTRLGILTEAARLNYRAKENIQPFATAGLLQVVNRSYSNTVVNAATSSALPQLTLSNNGFFLGAGFMYKYKHLRLTPYYQYGERGSSYRDNLVSLKADFLCN